MNQNDLFFTVLFAYLKFGPLSICRDNMRHVCEVSRLILMRFYGTEVAYIARAR